MTAAENPRWMTVTGRLLSTVAILFLLMDAAMKLPPLAVVQETFAQMGWPADPGTARMLGTILLAATLLHLWPPTALIGAILVTGYLGGAIATHVRIASPLFSHILFGAYLAFLLWGGLWLRSPALRALMPIRQ